MPTEGYTASTSLFCRCSGLLTRSGDNRELMSECFSAETDRQEAKNMLNSEAVHRFDTSELVVDSDVRLRPRTCFASSARLSEKRNPLARALLPNNAIKATPLRSAPYRNRWAALRRLGRHLRSNHNVSMARPCLYRAGVCRRCTESPSPSHCRKPRTCLVSLCNLVTPSFLQCRPTRRLNCDRRFAPAR